MLAETDAPQAPAAPVLGWAEGCPTPALELSAQGAVVQVNAALTAWLGWSLADLRNQPLSHWMPDTAALPDAFAMAGTPEDVLVLGRDGHRHWARVWCQPTSDNGLRCALVDCSEEHRLRAEVERARAEQRLWFDLSPSGKVVFDAQGLILRSNAVFDNWVGRTPVTLADLSSPLQALLGWEDGRLRADLRPGFPPVETWAELDDVQAGPQRLQARLQACSAEQGEQRVVAVVVDHSADAQHELATLRQEALVQAAGVEVVRLEALGPARARALLGARGVSSAQIPALPLVSLPAVTAVGLEPSGAERLRAAWQNGLRGEVRYGLAHAQLGRRRYLTQVQPARLGNGAIGATFVTLDVTDRERERHEREELLRELTTILDGSPVGIAYLKQGRLMRCNLRFERMLGFTPGAAAGLALTELLQLRGSGCDGVDHALAALLANHAADVELALPELDPHGLPVGNHRWYSMALRPASGEQLAPEAVVVLNDITRLREQQSEVERALRERELMFNQSDVAIAWVRQGRVVRANPALTEMTGLRPAELADCPLESLFVAGDAQPLNADARTWLTLRGRHSGEYRLQPRLGAPRWVQVSLRQADSRNHQSDLICAMVDVDERQRAREALQQLAGRTRAVLDSVLVGIVTLGEAGIEWMNRSARRMFAGELQDFLGLQLSCVATPDPDHPLARTDWLQRLGDGESEIFECRLQARDGREFWVVGNAVAMPREAMGGRQVTFALLDIEARRQAEVRVSSAKASLQRLMETAPLAIAVFDAATLQIVECNQGAAGFFGRPVPELLGRTPEDGLALPEQAAALRASLELARDTPEGVRREISQAAIPGAAAQRWDTRFVHLDSPKVPGAAEGAGQILLLANDVTELRLAEQARLDAAIAQREMLVKEVHHRIKNNLQGVAGLLQQTAQRRPEMREALQEAIGQVQAIAQVYGLQVGAAGPMELLGVLRAVAGTVQRSLGALIEVGLAPSAEPRALVRWMLPEAESIPLALSLNELLINAVRHGGCTAGAGVVRCTVVSSDQEVRIDILNPGRLPKDFELKPGPSAMHGLGLVRALLPRRAATLEMGDGEAGVLTRLTLRPPSVQRQVPDTPV
ncbi:MAG: PAS domain S-box protein [Rubrivivax sp.]|nr:PAS domain S-box protein [Rubrivivax sp.]